MYAVIETGGKQYRVAPGESIEVETLVGDVGAEIAARKRWFSSSSARNNTSAPSGTGRITPACK
jgi:ribosomal protein L21